MRRKIKLRNPFARVLASRLYRRRMIKAKKGKGSYKRRPKHSSGRRFLCKLLARVDALDYGGLDHMRVFRVTSKL
ncbi:MAG: ribosome alternative rescue factor ArfA [Proteobacteria bacterium]|nr:ribosome alternative rescue factor ArfA [Pseudomonadota bacterium]